MAFTGGDFGCTPRRGLLYAGEHEGGRAGVLVERVRDLDVSSDGLVQSHDARVRAGEDVRQVAAELSITSSMLSALRREVDTQKRPKSEALRPLLAEIGAEQGFSAQRTFSFTFPEVGVMKSYNPDCVWLDGAPVEKNTVAIFEIDGGIGGISPKHRAGGCT